MNRQQFRRMQVETVKEFQRQINSNATKVYEGLLGKKLKEVFKDTKFKTLKRFKHNGVFSEKDCLIFSVMILGSHWDKMKDMFDWTDRVSLLLKILKEVKFNNHLEKKLFTCQNLVYEDFKDRGQQQTVTRMLRGLEETNWDDFSDTMLRLNHLFHSDDNKKLLDKSTSVSGKGWENEIYEDLDYLQQNEYITVYRGFNTRKEKDIRLSNNKKKQDYYTQKEGGGISYTTNKYIAFAFAYRFQLHYKNEYYEINNGADILDDQKFYDKMLGRATVGRYVVKSKDVKFYYNNRDEREVMIDERDVRLIDYRFVSNRELKTDLIQDILDDTHKTNYLTRQMQKRKHWLTKVWKSDVRITNQIRSLFN